MPPGPVIPAATLILIRDRPGAPPDLLVIERAGSMAFAAGATVFPGGRIDPVDHQHGQPANTDVPARIAAIRETIEEVGIAVGITPVPDAETVLRLRAGLAAGTPFAQLLDQEQLALDLAALVPFARWCPNFPETRVFDTMFFIARAPVDDVPSPDGSEAVTATWIDAGSVLADADAGRRHLIFPTRRTLERLARFPTFAAARSEARTIPPRLIVPWIEDRPDGRFLCIPEDCGYPVTAEPLGSVRRG